MTQSVPTHERVVRGSEVAEEIERAAAGQGLFSLAGRTVFGPVVLRHRTVACALDVRDCDFWGDVDLRYCEFLQAVNFSGCTFRRGFNCGDGDESHTVFRKDLLCRACVFRGAATFVGISCDGSGFFNRSRFEDRAEGANFGGARFGKSVEFVGGVFGGGACFNGMECGASATFESARFESPLHVVDFAAARLGTMLNCRSAVFRGGLYLYGLRCGLVATLQGARFEHSGRTVEFSNASFDYHLDCNDTDFAGPARFDGCTCVHGTFRGARFRDPRSGPSFRFAQVSSNLDLREARFTGGLSLEQAKVGGDLVLSGTEVHGHADLHGTKVRRLRWGDAFPFEDATVDLRTCTFELFAGPETRGARGRSATREAREHARRFVQAQRRDLFSRDPYLQLERFYSRGGDEEEAREIYYMGRCDARRNALDANGNVQWSRRRGSLDWLLKHLTGYGVKTHRVVPVLLVFLALGTAVFWRCEPEAAASARAAAAAPGPGTAPDPAPKLFRRAVYSLDLFIPVIELPFTEELKPVGLWTQAYALTHVVVGWILIPLVIASVSGVLRRAPGDSSGGAG